MPLKESSPALLPFDPLAFEGDPIGISSLSMSVEQIVLELALIDLKANLFEVFVLCIVHRYSQHPLTFSKAEGKITSVGETVFYYE